MTEPREIEVPDETKADIEKFAEEDEVSPAEVVDAAVRRLLADEERGREA